MSYQLTEEEQRIGYEKLCKTPKRDLVNWTLREIKNAAELQAENARLKRSFAELVKINGDKHRLLDETRRRVKELEETLRCIVSAFNNQQLSTLSASSCMHRLAVTALASAGDQPGSLRDPGRRNESSND